MEPKFSLDKISYNVIKKLDSLKMTLGTVESCTGGLISQYITKHPGSSKVFINGYITYSNTSKINLLNIDKKVLDKYGAVSKQTVLQMV
ncbi:MAG: Nicotinamide-nucleotide amidohydrolase PncC, partial [Alphaproteobacteria bacterium MarineAlpha9_Bin1]